MRKMNPYNNIFAAINLFYKRFERSDPRFKSATLVSLSQGLLIIALLAFLDKTLIHGIFVQKNKWIIVVSVLPILVYSVLFYNQKRATEIIENFKGKSDRVKSIWGIMAIISIFFPFVLIYVISKMP